MSESLFNKVAGLRTEAWGLRTVFLIEQLRWQFPKREIWFLILVCFL